MAHITEPPKRMDRSADFGVSFQCGCSVVYLGHCSHRVTRVIYCDSHAELDDVATRDAILARAKAQYAAAELLQPPL